MKLSNSFIAVKKINSSVPRSNFSEDDLTRAAELILKAEGIINPLVLRRTSPQYYEVVDGHFEYYAAARAKEMDSKNGEYIGAFIIESENEEILQQQVKLFRNREPGNNDVKQKLENLTAEVAKLAESVKKIENAVINKSKPTVVDGVKPEATPKQYDKMTVKQLQELAKTLDIKVSTKMKKNELIAAIKTSKAV
jgi:ParB family chromosome partitioning protein